MRPSLTGRLRSNQQTDFMRRLTTDEKDMRGTLRPSREKRTISQQQLERAPMAPTEWPLPVQKIWSDRCNDLKRAGYLNKTVLETLRRYCFCHHLCMEAEKRLLDNPADWRWHKIHDSNSKLLVMISSHFGWTPVTAAKVPVINHKKETAESLLR